MAVADLEAPVRLDSRRRLIENIGISGLFAVLAAFTLSTLDGGDTAPQAISAALLLLAAVYLVFPLGRRLVFSVPVVCLFLMACYGAVQTLWFPQKIVYDGWSDVLFWFTAATITFLAAQLFRNRQLGARFRLWLVFFGSAVCLLDLLEQASHTNKYFWLIQSRYTTVSGPFAYWNNFAQFVELFLPITLWLGAAGRKPVIGYLVLAGLQIGAVVASGSRAGSALAIVELIVVLVLLYSRNRNRTFLYAAGSAFLLSLLFIYAAGAGTLTNKLEQRDQLAIRRDLDKSSLAMIRERPLTGWGLGTYVPVYRMFALYDDGSWVNRAHNDWLEWTAGGGIFFSGLMLIVFVWSFKPAIRSVWGIGLIALCLHAIVDYPFARFGVCGWYFALLGMLTMTREEGSAMRAPFRKRRQRELSYRRPAA